MQTITKDKAIFAMSKNNPPVAHANPGETIAFETMDALANGITSEDQQLDTFDWNKVNPATGPLFINGAQPGNILKIKIEKIDIASKGVMLSIPGIGPLADQVTSAIKIVEVKGDKAIFNDKIHLPLNKMVGVIGTAPAGEAINCGTPCAHGGNMDCIEVKEGNTIYLPVNVEGALLAMGDLHAVMADGEVGCTGIEIEGKVTVTIDVVKDDLPTPFIESPTHIMALHSDESLDIACDTAIQKMHKHLVNRYGFDKNDAAMFLSLAGDTKIAQVVDPKKTCRIEVSKEYLQ